MPSAHSRCQAGAEILEPPSKYKKALKDRDERLKTMAAAPHPSLLEHQSDLPADCLVPTKYWAMGGLSTSLLVEKIICTIEPGVLSLANLRAMKKSVGMGFHTLLVEMVEFLTGCDAAFALKGLYREWGRFQSFLKSQHELRGRPGMPPDWSKDGYYITAVVPDGIKVTHRLQNVSLLWSAQAFPGGFDANSVVVQGNFSEKSAVLIQPCSEIFRPISLYAGFAKILCPSDGGSQNRLRPTLQDKVGAATASALAIGDGALALPAPASAAPASSLGPVSGSGSMSMFCTPPVKRRLSESNFESPGAVAASPWTPKDPSAEHLATASAGADSAKKSRMEDGLAAAAAEGEHRPSENVVYDESALVPPPPAALDE